MARRIMQEDKVFLERNLGEIKKNLAGQEAGLSRTLAIIREQGSKQAWKELYLKKQ